MPSYYDSTKNKPSKARVKYKKGGKVEYDKGGRTKTNSSALGQISEREASSSALGQISEHEASILRSLLSRIPNTKARGLLKGKALDEKWKKKADKAPRGLLKGKALDEKRRKKMSKGGQLKVRGMGAATRGGNFSRNG